MSDVENPRVFIDTNVIVYTYDDDAPVKRDEARRIIKDAFINNTGVVSGQVLGETYVTLTKKIGISVNNALDEIRRYSRFRVVEITSNLVLRAIEIQADFQLSYWDSLIIAAAEFASCDTVWSEDLNDGQHYGSVTVRNPFAGLCCRRKSRTLPTAPAGMMSSSPKSHTYSPFASATHFRKFLSPPMFVSFVHHLRHGFDNDRR